MRLHIMCVIIKEYVSSFDTPETQIKTGVGKKHKKRQTMGLYHSTL